jgi:hypothetical protein
MFNVIARALVLVYTTASVLVLGWALATFLKLDDYGWIEPHKVWDGKDTGYRVASQLDKRTAALFDAMRTRERSVLAIEPALATLNETMDRFPKNHLFYLGELDKLRNAEGAIDPKAIKWDKGKIVTDTPGKAIGRPVLEGDIPEVKKSLKTALEEKKKVDEDIAKIGPENKELQKQIDDVTITLYGTKDDKGMSVDIGLYEVLEKEKGHQDKIEAEKVDITPVYVDAERRLETFLDRLRSMQRTLEAIPTGAEKK